jgi:hypothetical protein
MAMNKLKAYDVAVKESVRRSDVIIVFEKGFGDYGITPESDYLGDDDLIVARFYNGARE